MTYPPPIENLVVLIKTNDNKVLEVLLDEKEKAGIVAFLLRDKKIKVVDKDLSLTIKI